jgi:type VI secretion system protein VasD
MTVQGRILQTAFWLLLVVGLTGCFGGPSAIKIKGNIETSHDVNPDHAGRPSPVVVRVYQLRSPGPFLNADFFDLYDNANATLGQNLIIWEEFEFKPGEAREYNTKFDIDTKYVGVIAAYRDLENSRWRELVTLPDKKKVHLNIKLDSLAVSVSTDKR